MTSNRLPDSKGGNGRRRMLMALAAGAMAGALAPTRVVASSVGERSLRFGLTPAFVHDQHGLMADWRRYLEARLQTRVEFVTRNSYRETMDLLHQGRLDFAWLCDYPFLYLKDLVRLLAVPLNQGRPLYRAYLIVAADDQKRKAMIDLKGAAFAFSDPYSATGYLVPRYQLRQLGENPATFFRKTFFTWSHRKAVEAVATGMAEGASIDSFVFDTLALVKPELTGRTRIIDKSPEYGFPPLAAHRAVSTRDFSAMQQVLLDMSRDDTGRMLLKRLNLDGFIIGERRMYDSVAVMMRAFGEY